MTATKTLAGERVASTRPPRRKTTAQPGTANPGTAQSGTANPGTAQSVAERHGSRADRAARGKDIRTTVLLGSHADVGGSSARDPIGLLLGQAESRIPELVPLRHTRMLASPFSYYRGAALPMAADLGTVASSSLRVQLCGDAHLSNFGIFASPERRLVFDVNDFDETLPGPFEWDIKRLAASFAVAARQNGLDAKARRKILVTVGAAYRAAIRTFAKQTSLEVWYARLDVEQYLREHQAELTPRGFKGARALLSKARGNDSTQALGKLTELVDGHRRIVNDPPNVVAVEDLFSGVRADALYDFIGGVLSSYRKSIQSDRRHLLEQFSLVQVARKVVGVGSVGTRAWIILLDSGEGNEPLFLQAKEAQPSVLAAYCGTSAYHNEGKRVVAGQHLIQAQSDIFLGWTTSTTPEGVERDYYVRQLWDWKASVPVELMRPSGMRLYAQMCAWTLARAHARSGDRVAIAAYLGGSDVFDGAVADFAEAYADQNDRDFRAFQAGVTSGRIDAVTTGA